MGGQRYDDCDEDVRSYLGRVTDAYRGHLGEDMVAVWLVGSLALGCYNRALSDLDLLVVVEGVPAAETLRGLAHACVALTDTRPTPGDQETTVAKREVLRPLLHPTPHVFQYSADWTVKFRTSGFEPYADKADPDIVAHAAVALRCGVALHGPPPAAILGPPHWPDYIASLMDDLAWIVTEGHLPESPVYGVLNACRILMSLSEGEGTVASKAEGADWALRHLPAVHHPLVRKARDAYTQTVAVGPAERPTAGLTWDPGALAAFAEHVRQCAERGQSGDPSRRGTS